MLASLAYGFPIPMDALQVEGIRGIEARDISEAQSLGYRIKLLAVIKQVEGEAEVRVQPTLIPRDHLLASVHGVFNAVLVDGDVVGETLYYGQGAGRAATASAVIADIVDVARNLLHGSEGRVPAFIAHEDNGRVRDQDLAEGRNYLRMSLLDRPGVLGNVTRILGENGIGIASVIQREERQEQFVPVIVVTHTVREANLARALEAINQLDESGESVVRYRIEDLEASAG